MIPALLAQLGLPLLVRAAAAGLGRIEHPAAREAGTAQERVGEAIADGSITHRHIVEANRHIEALAELDSADHRTAMTEVNAILRAEVASRDAYVRRMGPTFGYIMAASWAAQMRAVAWVIATDPAAAGAVIAAMANLGTTWTVGLAVLGIYVYKRSEEKRPAASGAPPAGRVLADLVDRLHTPAR